MDGYFTVARFLGGAAPASVESPFDFDGDGKTDISIFRPLSGLWWYLRSSDGQVFNYILGNSNDRIVPADYTGDGKTDVAVWRPSTGEWFVLRSENNTYYAVPFGTANDLPAPADFDNDSKADLAVFRQSSGTWFIDKSAGGIEITNFGQNGDVATVGDFDGDGTADIAIFPCSEWPVVAKALNNGNFCRDFWKRVRPACGRRLHRRRQGGHRVLATGDRRMVCSPKRGLKLLQRAFWYRRRQADAGRLRWRRAIRHCGLSSIKPELVYQSDHVGTPDPAVRTGRG